MGIPQRTSDASGGRNAGPDPTPALRAAIAGSAGAVRRFLFGMCGDWDRAEDLAQEALLKAWKSRLSFRGQCQPTTWIFAIARNHWRDQLRRKRAAPDTEPMDLHPNISANDPPPPAAAAREELAVALARAMAGLPPEQREALALRESRGLRFAEIAELLGVPAATAKSRVRYALLKLADQLQDFRPELES